MNVDQAIAFLVSALVAAITPGPSNTMIVATGSIVGFRRGLLCVLGASIGMGALLFCSALGLGQLVISQPIVLKTMNWCGAAFLFWLAWKIANSGCASEISKAKPVGLIGAAAFQWANLKGWLVAVSAAGTYLQEATNNPVTKAAMFGALFFIAAFPSGLIWLLLGAAASQMLRDERRARIFNVSMGVALAASVAMMFC